MPSEKQRDPATGEVLVAILNNLLDFGIARDQHWYRIPIDSAEKWLKRRWSPEWIAFYQTAAFPSEKQTVTYYAKVKNITQAMRWQLISEQPPTGKGLRRYHKVAIGDLERLPTPIINTGKRKRIIFIQTTWHKLMQASEINDLYDDSPLEDALWAELKQMKIGAERQYLIDVPGRRYFLDFAIPCTKGTLAIETDGDTWHTNAQQIPLDNLRDNDLETKGLHLLRFNTHHIRERMHEYCLPTIVDTINRLGGLDEGQVAPRRIELDGHVQQPSLFDDPPADTP